MEAAAPSAASMHGWSFVRLQWVLSSKRNGGSPDGRREGILGSQIGWQQNSYGKDKGSSSGKKSGDGIKLYSVYGAQRRHANCATGEHLRIRTIKPYLET